MAGEGGSLYLFALCGISILNNIFYYVLTGRVGSFHGLSIASWVSYAVTQVAILLVVWAFFMWRRCDMVAVIRPRPMKNVKRYALLLPIALATMLAFLPVSMLFTAFFDVIGFRGGVSAGAIVYDNAGIFFLSLFLIALLPAIGEEVLMRGGVLSALTSRGAVFGVFISALLFALLHANPLQTAYQFCLGAVLAVLFLLSGSLVPCVIVHFLNNLFSLLMTAYIPQIDAAIVGLGAWNWLTGTAAFVVCTTLLVVLLFLYYRAGRPKEENGSFKVVDGGVVFEEYTIRAYAEDATEKKKAPAFFGVLKQSFAFVGTLFTRRGWGKVERTLSLESGIPYYGKSQSMFGVWLAVGLSAAYWVLALVMGLSV